MLKNEVYQVWESECCSLELAKKLLDIEIPQQSLFWWLSGGVPERWYLHSDGCYSKPYHPENISAFTASELIGMTPQWITTKENEPFNNFNFILDMRRIYIKDKLIRHYCINYHCDTVTLESGSPFFAHTFYKHVISDKKLADALAKNLIELFEKGLLTIEVKENEVK